MIQTVVKRDGRIVGYNEEKIKAAIRKAMLQTEAGEDEGLIQRIADRIGARGRSQMSVEEIQDQVELELMKSPRKEVARCYINYRHNRSVARRAKTRDIFLEIINAKNNDITRENANMNADTPAGMMMKFASETTKPFVDDYILSEEVREAVRGNYLHIHDKDYYPTKSLTCVQHPLDSILNHGFVAGHGESRPAKRIETASIIACISMETAQNEMHGGQAIPAFDFYLAPFVRRTFIEELKVLEQVSNQDLSDMYDKPVDDYVVRELDFLQGRERLWQHAINRTACRVHQAMEAFIHNMNTIHSRGGNQVVFSSINYGTDTSAEGRCVIRELLNSTYEGVGNGATAIFPIQIWKKKRGVSYLPTDRNYDLYQLACKVTARRFFPNFVNLDATYNQHELWRADDPKRYVNEVATMGCRTRVFENRFGPKTSIGRGNISFSTINIVRLAIECMNIPDKQQRIDSFFARLDEMLDITARQLMERFDFQRTAMAKQFPLLMSQLWIGSEKLNPDDTIESVINQGTLGIGFIGLAECLIALVGKHHGESEEAQQLGVRIVTYMRDRVVEFSERYQHNFSVLATPAEGLSGKFTKRDRKDFGEIPGVTDKVSFIFKDVASGAWYEKYLQSAYDNKIVGGTSADTYSPDSQLTHAQIMVMVSQLHSKQKDDNYDFQANKPAGSAWYQAYEDYCKAEGIIDDRFDGKEMQNVSRAEMAYYFAHTLEVRYYTEKKSVEFNDISASDYASDILTLAKADIVGGKGDGKYAPDALVTRAETSVFVSNILDAME